MRSPRPLQVAYPCDYYDCNQFDSLVVVNEQSLANPSVFESGVDNTTLLIHIEDESLDQYASQPENPFHYINSESSIVRHIEALDVQRGGQVEPNSRFSSSKRKKATIWRIVLPQL